MSMGVDLGRFHHGKGFQHRRRILPDKRRRILPDKRPYRTRAWAKTGSQDQVMNSDYNYLDGENPQH